MADGSYIPKICAVEHIDFEALKEFMRKYKYKTFRTGSNEPEYFDHSSVFFGSIYCGILDGLRVINNIDEKLYVGYLDGTGERYTNFDNRFEHLYDKVLDVLIDIEFLKPVGMLSGIRHGYYSIN